MIGFHARQDPVVGEEFTPALDGDQSGSLAILEDTISVRRLSPLECERLMGLPDGWTEGQSDSARYAQLGNSVAVPVVEWIARRLLAVDGELAG